MTKKNLRVLAITPLVAASLIFSSISPTAISGASLSEQNQETEVVVVYKNNSGKEKILNQAITVLDQLVALNALKVTLTEASINDLKADPDIKYIERKANEEVELLGNPAQWNVEAVNAPDAWADGYTGQGIKVAIIDSGVSIHSELPNVAARLSFVDDDPTTTYNEASPDDHIGHGTHVAGIVGAKRDGGLIANADIVGVAPDVSLYSLKALGGETGSLYDVIEAIDWAINHDMDIINLSLGSPTHVQLLQDAVNRAYQAGILLVGAAGNDGVGTPVNYPAKYDSVIAVSSVDSYKRISDFSSTGPEVEFTAPGSSINSTYTGSTYSYANASGTSQATPHVAGFLALLMQKYPTMSASGLRVMLQKYADDLGNTGRDEYFGYGFINYLAFDDQAPAEVSSLRVNNTSTNSITISWTNPYDQDFSKALIMVNGVKVGESTKTQNSFTIQNLKQATEYQITVKTVDTKGNVSTGTGLSASTSADTQAPSEVKASQISNVSANSAMISWINPEEADFAKVNIYLNGQIVSSVAKSAQTNFTFSGLKPETSYSALLKTVDQLGNESAGIALNFTTAKAADEPPVQQPVPSAPGEFTEIPVTKEIWTEKEETIEVDASNIENAAKLIFAPQVWDELQAADKDLLIHLDRGLITLPEETLAEINLNNETAITVDIENPSFSNGQKMITDILKIEVLDENSQQPVKVFSKPITLSLELNAGTSITSGAATFGAVYNEELKQWQFAGGKISGNLFVIETKQTGAFAVLENSKTFTDIKSHWARAEIEHLASRLIIQGKTEDAFVPNEQVTRAQFIVLLARMLSIPTAELEGTFKDVTASQSWSAAYIEAAYRYGITTGFADSTFRPNQVITRQEMAAMIVRALKVEKPEALSASITSGTFKDDRNLSTTFKEEIYIATKAGLLKGRADGSFDPLAKATRAETSVVLYRALNK
jgi:subtilisin family serine protease